MQKHIAIHVYCPVPDVPDKFMRMLSCGGLFPTHKISNLDRSDDPGQKKGLGSLEMKTFPMSSMKFGERADQE